jgi:type IV secretion system protein TrbG
MQGKFKTVTIIALAVLTLFGGVSCATGSGYSRTYGSTAEVINVQGKDWTNANAEIPTTAIIQPEDLVVSPVIDITTLKAETNAETATVRSSTLEQDVKKEAIKAELETNPLASTELDEDFSDGFKTGGTVDTETGVTGKTSGQLATQAADNSFVYINSSTAFTGAIAEYDYLEGRIYEVITSPNAITDIRLKPGESIAASPIVNDGGTSWQFSMGTSVENGETVQHLFVKPTTVGLDTSMILLTDQRTYYFRIASFPKSYMTALRFRYPQATEDGYYVQEDFAEFIEEQAITKSTSGSAYSIDLTSAEYNYTIRTVKGKPAWTPQQAFSDATKTYIQFPVSILTSSDMPSVYVVRDNEETLVNYRYIGNIVQLDTVITSNEYILLKSGQNEQVKISKAK